MRKLLLLVVILCMFGCERLTKNAKHLQSGFTGLNRRITLYGCDGAIIQSWQGKFMVELNGPTASWINDDNKEVKISGTFVIEEF